MTDLEQSALNLRRSWVEAADMLSITGLAMIVAPTRGLLERSLAEAGAALEGERARAALHGTREAWERRAESRRAARYVTLTDLASASS